jgi:Zn-finger nucleic acid-binding protein
MPLLICPNCNVGMSQIQRSGIELDICPQCRGVWLDRGELEKLLEPIRQLAQEPGRPDMPNPAHGYEKPWGKHHDHDHDHGKHSGYHKKRGWQDMLDIFD